MHLFHKIYEICSINKHKLSISNIFLIHVISLNAFWQFLRLGNSTWDFLGANFCSRDFSRFWFLPPFNHLHHLKFGVSPVILESLWIWKVRNPFEQQQQHMGDRPDIPKYPSAYSLPVSSLFEILGEWAE